MKIIGSDYDGTLNHNGIDDIKRKAIEKWRSAGNVFALVSGRPGQGAIELQQEHQFACDYFVASNGAVIMDSNSRVLHADCCDPDQAVPLIKYLFSLGCPFAHIHSEVYFNIVPSLDNCNVDKAYTLDNMPSIPYYTQISAWKPSCEEAEAVAAKVRENFGEHFNPMQNGLNIDIVRKDVNKAKGLYRLMELLGAKYDDVITVGDNVNDYDMIKEFRSYAMESGVAEIKELADSVTPGVAEMIEWELNA